MKHEQDAPLEAPPQSEPRHLYPLSYHQEMAAYLQSRHRAVWESFDAAQKSVNRRADVELHLLKSAYRLSPSDHPELHASVAKARAILGVEQPITLYQAHRGHADNASMSYTEEQGHLKFEGEILSYLQPEELDGLIGHEIGHYKLWCENQSAILTSSRILDAMASERDVHSSLIESQRLHRLYTEIYCDRAGALVSGSPEPMVSVLLKLSAGDIRVAPEHYIAQAEEIFQKSAEERSQGNTHPEHFIRARAVARWCRERDARAVDDLVTEMIEGRKHLGDLDVLARDRLTIWTRSVLHRLTDLVAPSPGSAWERHRERFLPLETERADEERVDLATIRKGLLPLSATVRDYFGYLLLDFATIDPERRDAIRRCHEVAGELGLSSRFAELTSRNVPALAA